MWWLIGLIIAGIYSIAQSILDSLRQEVAVERLKWESSYKKVEQEVLSQQRALNYELQKAQDERSFERLRNLHTSSRKIADTTYGVLNDARKTLEAMGRAIVTAAQQRELLEKRRHSTWNPFESSQLEKEIQGLLKLRNEILVPDKNTVKADKDRIYQEVVRLNQQTAELRDMIKNRCGIKGARWYADLMDRTERRRLGLPIQQPQPRIESKIRGVVKFYDSKKGFGFITASNGTDVHVGQSNLKNTSMLNQGDQVEFYIRDGDKGKWAADVTRL